VSNNCRESACGARIVWRRVEVNGQMRNRAFNPDGTEHLTTCTGEEARRRRRRMGMEPGVFPVSPSRLELYRRCPRAYKRRYLDHEPEDRSDPRLVLGALAHARQAAMLKGGGVIPSVEELCEQERTAFPLELADDWAYLCRVMDQTDWDTRDAAIEESQVVTWQDGAMTVEFEVKLDFWRIVSAQEAGITDFKTSWDVLAPRALARDWQARSYPWTLWKLYPYLERIWFQLYSYRLQRTVRAEPAAERDYFVPADFNDFEGALRAEVHRMLIDQDFDPNPFCRVCPLGAHPVAHYPVTFDAQGGVVLTEPTSEDEARRLMEFTWAAQRIASAGKTLLRPWCAEHRDLGPLGFQEHTRRVLRPATEDDEGKATPTALQVLELLGSNEEWTPQVAKAITLDGDWLKAILGSKKKWTTLADALQPYLEERIETRYEWANSDRLEAPKAPETTSPQPLSHAHDCHEIEAQRPDTVALELPLEED
jgi:hypothetical protein